MFAIESTKPNRRTATIVDKQTSGQKTAAVRKRENRERNARKVASEAVAAGMTAVEFQSLKALEAHELRAKCGPQIKGSVPAPLPSTKTVVAFGEEPRKTKKARRIRRH